MILSFNKNCIEYLFCYIPNIKEETSNMTDMTLAMEMDVTKISKIQRSS